MPLFWVRLNAPRIVNRVMLRQAKPVHVMRNPVHGCENRNIAPTPVRLMPNEPEKISSPMSSLLPTWPGGEGRINARLKNVYP